MHIYEFLENYPIFKGNIGGVSRWSQKNNTFYLKNWREGQLLHELCHFVEMDIDRLLLSNFGFKYLLNKPMSLNSAKVMCKRELHVWAYTQNLVKDEYIFAKNENKFNYRKHLKFIIYPVAYLENSQDLDSFLSWAEKYYEESLKIYTTEKFIKDFNTRYEFLESQAKRLVAA